MIKKLMNSPVDLQLVEKHYKIKITPTIKFKLDSLKNKDLIGLEAMQPICKFVGEGFVEGGTKKIVFTELKQSYLDEYMKNHFGVL